MTEMVDAKQAVQKVLKTAPEDIQLHRIHGMYTGHILDIRKTLIQERAVDRDQLLLDALRSVVSFLLEQGEGGSARFIGDHLETIGNREDAFREAEVLAEGRDLELEALAKDHDRREGVRDTIVIIFKILLWLAFTAFIVGGLIWIWHLLLPPASHWLTPGQIDKIETILSTSVIAALFSKMAEKYF